MTIRSFHHHHFFRHHIVLHPNTTFAIFFYIPEATFSSTATVGEGVSKDRDIGREWSFKFFYMKNLMIE